MYALFEALFRNSYWRMMLRPATWHEAGMSLRRVHKDKRARKHLLQIGLMLLIPVLCFAYLAWIVGSGAVYFVPFVIPVILWRRRREKQEEVIRIIPSAKPVEPRLSKQEEQRLRQYFVKLALFYSVMIARASSEAFLKQKVLPEGFEVVSRRKHLALLKEHSLWDEMAHRDRDMVMMADGHWEWPQINEVTVGIEALRLLRWMLRIDFYLPVIGQQMRGDYSIAHDLVDNPGKATARKDLIDASTMRTALEAADNYFVRCVAEGMSRGYFEASDEEAAEWATSVSDQLRGKQHEDLVLGQKLVSEASEEELRWATTLSERRRVFLRWALAVMKDGKIPEWQISVFPEELGDHSVAESPDTV